MERKKMRDNNLKNGQSWLFLLEISVSMILFVVAATILFGLFVNARVKSDKAKALHESTIVLSNITSIARDSNSLEDIEKNLSNEYEVKVLKESDGSKKLRVKLDSKNYVIVSASREEYGMRYEISFFESGSDSALDKVDVFENDEL